MISQPITHVDKAAGIELENTLSPIALRSSGTGSERDIYRSRQIGSAVTAGSDRLPFEHDRDRILHCRQFRKLAGKTQLLIVPNRGDLRTRLTHTMEVYQLATSLGRRFNLNIPAVEAIALGHDTGHTPFGHAGEEALNELLKSVGGFHHAAHSVRTLDRTVYDSQILQTEQTCGLNLTWAVREGILKHGWFEGRTSPYHIPPLQTYEWDLASPQIRKHGSVEAQAVALADQIAYLNHDIDDLVLYGFEKILSTRTVKEFFKRHQVLAEEKVRYATWERTKQIFLTLLTEDQQSRIKMLVRDAVNASKDRINNAVKGELDRDAQPLIEFSPELRETRNLFYHFFKECVYTDIRIQHKNDNAKGCIRFLHDFFEKLFAENHDLLPIHIQHELNPDSPPPWWQTYLANDAVSGAMAAAGSVQSPLTDLSIACKLAAADVVADLTDREALAAFRTLDETESTAGIEALDRILSTFPNESQSEINRRRRDDTKQRLLGLFPVAGT